MDIFIHGFNIGVRGSYIALKKIHQAFGDFKKAWEYADYGDFLRAGIGDETTRNITTARAKINLKDEAEKYKKNGVLLLDFLSEDFPVSLKNIPDAPFLLYVKGNINCLGDNKRDQDGEFIIGGDKIAIVGTRLPSEYGVNACKKIAKNITEARGIVVSGLALGIDGIAHTEAVNLGRPTIAVIASGINIITPRTHTGLAMKILKAGGAVVSEYPNVDATFKYKFLQRNRIISGLSRATVIIEAREKSGALITAKHALGQDRGVYSLVGDITRDQAFGCNNLVKNCGAEPIVSISRLMAELGFSMEESRKSSLNKTGLKVLENIKKDGNNFSVLANNLNIPAEELSAIILQLEMEGLINE